MDVLLKFRKFLIMASLILALFTDFKATRGIYLQFLESLVENKYFYSILNYIAYLGLMELVFK